MSSNDAESAPLMPQATEPFRNGTQLKESNGDESRFPQINGGADLQNYSMDDDSAPSEGTSESSSSPTYSADTVAAISSLINDESPLFRSSDTNSTSSTLARSDRQSKNYELTVSDRATAIMSVYRDYLTEGLDAAERQDDAQDSADFASAAPPREPLLIRDDGHLLLLDGDLDRIHVDRSGYIQGGEAGERTELEGKKILTARELRKEEIKLAALEKFCSESTKEKKRKKKRKRHRRLEEQDDGMRTTKSLQSRSTGKSSMSSRDGKSRQTAASTTAAFRLKADVALRAVSDAAASAIGKAAVAGRTTAAAIKTKYRDGTVDLDSLKRDVDEMNDYDFKSYDRDIYDGDGGLAPPSAEYNDYMDDMEYGISPLGDKGLVFRSDGDEEEDNASFKEICEDLGVTVGTHPNLERYDGRRGYRYPIFRSKKFRKAVCYGSIVMLIGVVAVSIASALTHGFEAARQRRSPPLPDYIEDEKWREEQKVIWEEEHGEKYTGYNNVAVVVPDVSNINGVEDVMPPPPMSKKDKELQEVSAAYRPVWFDRTTGWKGQTYQEALDFCATYSDYIPCPYEVYCPTKDKTLLSGVMDHDGESWSAVINMNNEWVQVGTEGECDLYTEKYKKEPQWGIDGLNNEMITRHIMCCRKHPYEEGSVWDVPNEPGSGGNDYVHKPVTVTTASEEVSSVEGSDGDVSDGSDNIEDSSNVEDNSDTGDTTEDSTIATPIDTASYADIAAAEGLTYMTEWEINIQNAHHPAWFSNEFGWQGTTYLDAQAFCESIPHGAGTLQLCPLQAYCPNGPRNDKPLYLQMGAFEGEQWAPAMLTEDAGQWVMVGMLNKDPSSTCRTYMQLHHKEPSWGVDGSRTDIKKHILCCEPVSIESGGNILLGDEGLAMTDNALTESTPTEAITLSDILGDTQSEQDDQGESDVADGSLTDVVVGIQTSGSESSYSSSTNGDDKINGIYATFDPMWLDSSFGWNGGSHSDALEFCGKFTGGRGKKMELCPYAAYCPHGPSKAVIGGHQSNYNDEGEQWAPVYGQQNHWVLISTRGGNLATTCLSYIQLYDEMPSWGLDDSNAEMKKHIMCCSPIQ